MQMLLKLYKYCVNLCKYCLKLHKYVQTFLDDIINDGLAHAGLVHATLYNAFRNYYENFLLVILCKYDLGLIRFAIAKWFFCGVLFLCSLEVATGYLHICAIFHNLFLEFWNNGYVDVVDLFKNISKNFWSIEKPFSLFLQPPLPKDLHILTHKTIDSINNIETVESIESMNNMETIRPNPHIARPYSFYVCAFAILYWGVCMASSGA